MEIESTSSQQTRLSRRKPICVSSTGTRFTQSVSLTVRQPMKVLRIKQKSFQRQLEFNKSSRARGKESKWQAGEANTIKQQTRVVAKARYIARNSAGSDTPYACGSCVRFHNVHTGQRLWIRVFLFLAVREHCSAAQFQSSLATFWSMDIYSGATQQWTEFFLQTKDNWHENARAHLSFVADCSRKQQLADNG